jgi:hypothetical protein
MHKQVERESATYNTSRVTVTIYSLFAALRADLAAALYQGPSAVQEVPMTNPSVAMRR